MLVRRPSEREGHVASVAVPRVRGAKESQSKYTTCERDKYIDAMNLQQLSWLGNSHRNVEQRKAGSVGRKGHTLLWPFTSHQRTHFFLTLGDSFADLPVEVRGVIALVPQFRLPRSFRNMDQAGQVGLVQRKSASQSLFLDTVRPLSDCTRLVREHTRLDVRFYTLPDLLRQIGTSDWSPFCSVMAGVYLISVSAEQMLVVVKVPCRECEQWVSNELQMASAECLFEVSWCVPGSDRESCSSRK
jgi:hypothetical protein